MMCYLYEVTINYRNKTKLAIRMVKYLIREKHPIF
jgi:hypothetical protein